MSRVDDPRVFSKAHKVALDKQVRSTLDPKAKELEDSTEETDSQVVLREDLRALVDLSSMDLSICTLREETIRLTMPIRLVTSSRDIGKRSLPSSLGWWMPRLRLPSMFCSLTFVTPPPSLYVWSVSRLFLLFGAIFSSGSSSLSLSPLTCFTSVYLYYMQCDLGPL